MAYRIINKRDAELLLETSYASLRDAEKDLRHASPGTYMIVRVAADDVVVQAPDETPVLNKVVIGKRTFTRKPKAQLEGRASNGNGAGKGKHKSKSTEDLSYSSSILEE